MMGVRKSMLFALLALLAAGCGGSGAGEEPPQVCTLIACINSIEVRLEGELSYPYSVSVRTEEDYFKFACENAGSEIPAGLSATGDCAAGTFTMFNFNPATATLTLEFPGESVEMAVEPDYEAFRPNGPGCEPECLFGTVVVPIP